MRPLSINAHSGSVPLGQVRVEGQPFMLELAQYANARVAVVLTGSKPAPLPVSTNVPTIELGPEQFLVQFDDHLFGLRRSLLGSGFLQDTGSRVHKDDVSYEVWRLTVPLPPGYHRAPLLG